MMLDLDYLKSRHNYWKLRIGEYKIWNPTLFQPVEFSLRKHHKRYNALFQRRVKTFLGKKEISDKIVFYNKVEDFDPRFVDSVLVHEMIHQYIIQNDMKDTSPHGRIFKEYMNKINKSFLEELNIKIRDVNPSLPMRGEGEKCHSLLLVNFNNLTTICAVVNPAKSAYFDSLLKRNMKNWNIKTYLWAESNDVYFNQFSRCTSRLHGLKKNTYEIEQFCKDYNIRIVQKAGIPSSHKKKWFVFSFHREN